MDVERRRATNSQRAVWSLLVACAALSPFVPALVQFARLGIPDTLFVGDAASLELRTWQAAHGVQFVGPYSPQGWSHPGPAFFYLALPVYEALGERGPALNFFVLLVNAALSVAAVITWRRLLGGASALILAALIGIYVGVAAPYVPTGEWNAVSPLLPLLFAAVLAVRVAVESGVTLIAFVVVASAIVQTDIGLGPAVLALVVLVASSIAWRFLPRPDGPRPPHSWVLVAAAMALIACWALPLYEARVHNPNNLQQLVFYYDAPHPVEHAWPTVITRASEQLALVPLSMVRMFGVGAESLATTFAAASIQVLGLVVTLVAGLLFGRRVMALMAGVALVWIAVALLTVRATRGDLHPQLLFWVAVVGLFASAVWFSALVSALDSRGAQRGVVITATFAGVVLAVSVLVPRPPVLSPEQPKLERLAAEISGYLQQHRRGAVIGIPAEEQWPMAMAVALHLRKRAIPFLVESKWTFMAGPSLAAEPGTTATLLFGDIAFRDHHDPSLTLVAHTDDTWVYAGSPY